MQKKENVNILENRSSGYPLSLVSEDIFHKNLIEKDIDPENISKIKFNSGTFKMGLNNEMNSANENSGSDLDIPGSELDDIQENIGSEDEENNYYSLGGDNHNNLDEDVIEP